MMQTTDVKMETSNFKISSNNECKALKVIPDQKSIKFILASARKKPQQSNTVIIARYQWLKKHKLLVPNEMELPNLCLTIKNGKLIRAFYSDVLSHIIKKQKYFIQVLN